MCSIILVHETYFVADEGLKSTVFAGMRVSTVDSCKYFTGKSHAAIRTWQCSVTVIPTDAGLRSKWTLCTNMVCQVLFGNCTACRVSSEERAVQPLPSLSTEYQ